MAADFSRGEVDSIYVDADERYVVSLIVGYSGPDVRSPAEAAHCALELTRDGGCDGTVWFVHDRVTGRMNRFEQQLIESPPSPCRNAACDDDPDEGEGYDGYCRSCADALSADAASI